MSDHKLIYYLINRHNIATHTLTPLLHQDDAKGPEDMAAKREALLEKRLRREKEAQEKKVQQEQEQEEKKEAARSVCSFLPLPPLLP